MAPQGWAAEQEEAMVLFLDHVAIAVRDLDGAKRFFRLLGFEVADAVVIQGEQFSQYMGLPDLRPIT